MLTEDKLKIIHEFENELVYQEEGFRDNCLIYVYHVYSKYATEINRLDIKLTRKRSRILTSSPSKGYHAIWYFVAWYPT